VGLVYKSVALELGVKLRLEGCRLVVGETLSSVVSRLVDVYEKSLEDEDKVNSGSLLGDVVSER